MRIDTAKAIKNAELAAAREEGIDSGKLEAAARLNKHSGQAININEWINRLRKWMC